jgi:hypothetical protein
MMVFSTMRLLQFNETRLLQFNETQIASGLSYAFGEGVTEVTGVLFLTG